MTRLTSQDMPGIAANLDDYDAELFLKTGFNLRGLACCAAGFDETAFSGRASSSKAAVVPLSCGQGVIAGFCEAVERILAHLGYDAAVTRQSDAAGLEADVMVSEVVRPHFVSVFFVGAASCREIAAGCLR